MGSKTFYVTTAITYANSKPHIGHAYEEIGTDVLARWRRMCGDDVRFVTGSDEHSANVEAKAAELGKSPQAYCDDMAALFEATWRLLDIRYDRFIRTSEPLHHRAAQEMVRRARAAGDIYPGRYEGSYCNSCERYYAENELAGGLCPVHQTEPIWLAEENYFFRLSRFTEPLRRHIEAHPEFIRPETRRNEILNILKEGLKDISVSRATRAWGVPFPDAPDQRIYVWFDALINYLSAVGFPDDMDLFERCWPADVHVIGKDIIRFHCIIWPAMLMSAGLPLPRRVFGHGFITLKGEKMSKTRGNVMDVQDSIREFGVDAIRYVLMASNAFGTDGDVSEGGLVERYNSDLANDLGNLLNRTLTMVEKYLAGRAPDPTSAPEGEGPARTVSALREQYGPAMDALDFNVALARVMDMVKAANKLIDEAAPWALVKQGEHARLGRVLYSLLEILRLAAVHLYPVMPNTFGRILRQLGDPDPGRPPRLPEDGVWGGIPGGRPTAKEAPLFPRRDKVV